MKYSISYWITIFAIFFFTACGSNQAPENETSENESAQLGEVYFPVTGAEEAQPYFKKGLLLLHSFEYEDARDEFLKAQELDSTFAMAYWGEAMTYNHSLWQRQEKEKAVAALNKLGASAAARGLLVKTELEQDFFEAIELLLGEGTKYERDLAYKSFLKKLTQKYPDNHEVAAFYAISLLGSSRNGRDEELYAKSAKIAQSIIAENPSHPGALHYLIHSYDDPGHAQLAKAAADSYSKVAPDAAHALHMPSHIYVALGNWDDVINCNIASWNASVKRKERKELETDALSFHAFNWLQYGFLQRNELQSANKLLSDMQQYASENSTKQARSYLVAMKGAQLVESNDWTGELAAIDINVEDLPLTKRAGHSFMEGMKAYMEKNATKLNSIIEDMNTSRQTAQLAVGEKGFAMCSSAGFANKPASQLDIDMAKVMEWELKAYEASLEGKPDQARKYFEEASELDESLSYSFGPPTILKPVHEAYGEWLLEQKDWEKALVVFEQSLKRHPRRLRSLQGLKKAGEQLQKKEIVALADKELSVSLKEKKWAAIL